MHAFLAFLQGLAGSFHNALAYVTSVQPGIQVQGSASGFARISAWDCYILTGNILSLIGTKTPGAARVSVVTASPFLFFLFWTVVWLCEALWRYRTPQLTSGWLRHLGKRLIVTCLCIAFLLCPLVIGSSLEIFSCVSISQPSDVESFFPFEVVPVNTGSYWALDTSLQCWVSEHRYAA